MINMDSTVKIRGSKFSCDGKSAKLVYQRDGSNKGRRVVGTGEDVGTLVATDKGIAIDSVEGLVLKEASGVVGLHGGGASGLGL